MYLQHLITAVVLLMVLHPGKTSGVNQKRRQRNKQQRQQTPDYNNLIYEENRPKNVAILKSSNGLADNWGLPKTKSYGSWRLSGPQRKNSVLERAPQVDKVEVPEYFLNLVNFSNSDYNTEQCSDANYKKKAKQEFGCRSRETIVHLSHSDGFKLSPSAVAVKRCDGVCPWYSECIPSVKEYKTFYIRQIHQGNITCGKIDVEEHINCSCSCPKRACMPEQYYDTDECKCKCKENNNFNCPARKVYNATECRCKCKQFKKCSTGTLFDDNSCSCPRANATSLG